MNQSSRSLRRQFPLTIRSAAIRLHTGEVVEGDKHDDIRRKIKEGNGWVPVYGIDGFITSDGDFVARHKAARIALAAKQITKVIDPKRGLSSTDIL